MGETRELAAKSFLLNQKKNKKHPFAEEATLCKILKDCCHVLITKNTYIIKHINKMNPKFNKILIVQNNRC